jgi:hypothetical protein
MGYRSYRESGAIIATTIIPDLYHPRSYDPYGDQRRAAGQPVYDPVLDPNQASHGASADII